VSADKKKEPVEPSVSERDVLIFNINEVSNDTLESTRCQTKPLNTKSV
jgi:hypothetical protein